MNGQDSEWVVLGRVSGLFGVRGWVKVYSYTAPRSNILRYPEWLLKGSDGWVRCKVEDGRSQGKGIVVKLEGYDDRDRAAELIGLEIAIGRDQLPEAGRGEYYWTDLEGLQVVTREGVELGVIESLFETGSNDVMVVEGDRQRLIPFTAHVVVAVDLESGRVTVDWDPEF